MLLPTKFQLFFFIFWKRFYEKIWSFNFHGMSGERLQIYESLDTTGNHKKSLAQEVRQKNDISEYTSKGWRGSLLCLQQGRWVTVRPVRGHRTTKMNITFFIRNKMLNIFLFNNFFEKAVFSGKTVKKLFWRRIWQFLVKKGVLRQKLT